MTMGAGIAMLFFFGLMFLMLASYWTVFEKAGRPGWYALIPFWNIYQLVKIAGMRGISMLLLLVPFVNLFYAVGLNIRLARSFGQSTGFGIGLSLLSVLFWPMLAFGPAEYEGAALVTDDPFRERNPQQPYQNENGDWVEEVPISDW